MIKKFVCSFVLVIATLHVCFSQTLVTDRNDVTAFNLVTTRETASIVYDAMEDSLVQKVAQLLQSDIEKITGRKPVISPSTAATKNIVIIGSINQSRFIKQLINEKKLNVSAIHNKWEAHQIQVIKNPFKGVEQALVYCW